MTDPECAFDEGAVDRETRRRILSAYLSVALSLGPAYASFFAFFGAWRSFLAPAVFTGLSVAAWLLKRRNACGWATGLLLGGLWFGPAWAVVTTGALHSPLLIWLTPTPFMAGALLGRRAALGVGAVSVSLVLLLALSPLAGLFPAELASGPGHFLLSVLSAASAVALLTFYGWTTTRNFEDSQRALAAQRDALAQHNRDMGAILDNVAQGLVLVSMDGTVQAAQSAAMTRWFGRPPAGAKIWQFAAQYAPQVGAMLQLGWDELQAAVMPAEVVMGQLPTEVTIAGRTYSLSYEPVGDPSAPSAVLIVMSDVTDERARAREQARAAETLALFERYVADPATFASNRQELDHLITGVAAQTERVALARRLHTIKGTSAACGLTLLPTVAHQLEGLLEEAGALAPEQISTLTAAWREVLDRTAHWANAHRDAVLVHGDELATLRAGILRGQSSAALLRQLDEWRWERLETRLQAFATQARKLATQLGKPGLEVEVRAAGAVPPGQLEALWLDLVHVVRNAVDHGIEAPEQRRAAGKPAEGRLRLTAAVRDERLELSIADDGAGIRWERVAERAAARGLPFATQQELEAALFADGLSTRDVVSDVSGRGVGLAAVRATVEALGGTITVSSVAGQGATWTVGVPLTTPAREAAA